MDAPIIRVVLQRYETDCAVACLSMICGVTYENALVAIAQYVPDVCAEGLWVRHLPAAARALGFALRSKPRVDLDQDTGILMIVPRRKCTHHHLVILREGLIIETDGTLWEHQTYFAANHVTHGRLLTAARLTP